MTFKSCSSIRFSLTDWTLDRGCGGVVIIIIDFHFISRKILELIANLTGGNALMFR